MTIIWCMVPEIWREIDRIFCHFGPFFFHFTSLKTQKLKIYKKMKKTIQDNIILHSCTINDNHMMYGSWNMKHDWQNFLSFWAVFPLLPPEQPEKSKFWKTEKTPEDIIVLHKCIKNHDHILYCSLDMAHNRCNYYFSF